MTVTAYALTMTFLGTTFYVADAPIAYRQDMSWAECVEWIKDFDPGLSEVNTAITWCVETNRDGRVLRIERVIHK
jgi:hypothetical protein